jgi:hypothetical protein
MVCLRNICINTLHKGDSDDDDDDDDDDKNNNNIKPLADALIITMLGMSNITFPQPHVGTAFQHNCPDRSDICHKGILPAAVMTVWPKP